MLSIYAECHCLFLRGQNDFPKRVVTLNGAISGLNKSKMAAWPPSWKIQIAISLRRISQFTPCLVLGWGFRDLQIEWRYFWFDQIQ